MFRGDERNLWLRLGGTIAMTYPLDETAEDAERWWQAYQLAEDDQAGELRERAEAGDEHARRQLASWLSDRAKTEEAAEVIRPLADRGDEGAERWLARWLADDNHLDELRARADNGSYAALHELARWFASHEKTAELRALVADHRERLAGFLALGWHSMSVVRLAAELGDDTARRRLEVWLSRLHERANAGDEHAVRFLAENPEWRQLWADWALSRAPQPLGCFVAQHLPPGAVAGHARRIAVGPGLPLLLPFTAT